MSVTETRHARRHAIPATACMLLTAVLTAVLAVAGSPVCAAPKRSNLAASSHDHAVVFPPPFLLPFLLPPSRDAFYRVPSNITAYARGDIVRWRPLPSFSAFGSAAGRAYQLLYRTNGVDMLPDATVTTVVVPATPAPGPAKIVAIATPADSAAIDCQPSFALLESECETQLSKCKRASSPKGSLPCPARFLLQRGR